MLPSRSTQRFERSRRTLSKHRQAISGWQWKTAFFGTWPWLASQGGKVQHCRRPRSGHREKFLERPELPQMVRTRPRDGKSSGHRTDTHQVVSLSSIKRMLNNNSQHSLCLRHCSSFFNKSRLLDPIMLWNQYCYYPYFMDGKTKVWGGPSTQPEPG